MSNLIQSSSYVGISCWNQFLSLFDRVGVFWYDNDVFLFFWSLEPVFWASNSIKLTQNPLPYLISRRTSCWNWVFVVSFCLFDCLFVLSVPTTAKVISRWGPQLKFSSDRLVKPEIKHTTPGLQGEEYSDSLVFDEFETILNKYNWPLELFWDTFVFGLKS